MNLRGRFLLRVIAVFAASSAIAAGDEIGPQLLDSGRVDEAITALHGQISSSPNDAAAQNLLCRAHFTLGQWDRGIPACEKAVALAPDNGQYHLWLGRMYCGKADKGSIFTGMALVGKVRNEFETAVRLDPNNAEARCDLAEFYMEAPGIVGGGKDKALQQVGPLSELDPGRARWVSARVAEKRKDYATAESEYKAAVESSHGSASAWLNLGLFYRHRERYEDMEQALVHVRPAPIDRVDALVDAAEILIHAQRNLPEGVELLHAYLKLNKSVEQAPAFKVHYLLGNADE